MVLLNEPVPLVLQRMVAAFVATAVLSVYPDPSQMVASTPASAVACRLIVNTISSVADTHGAADWAVSVRMTLPAAMSAALGV